jgi:hypothetical protein
VTLRLSPAELIEVSGGYTQTSRQLEALRAAGFWRARLGRDGQVVLERAHYEAVCAGAVAPGARPSQTDRPQVRRVA